MTDPSHLADLCLRVGMAVLLGAAIGLERQWRLRTAGMRTNALVSVGSALFTVLGADAISGAGADPTRVAAQIASGIGFLGAGVIIRDGIHVRGVTTAATLWCAAAIGALCGAGMWEMAAAGGLCIVAINVLLRPLSNHVNRRLSARKSAADEKAHRLEDTDGADDEYLIEVVATSKSAARVQQLLVQMLARPDLAITSLQRQELPDSKVSLLVSVSADGDLDDSEPIQRAVHHLAHDPKVSASRWWSRDPHELVDEDAGLDRAAASTEDRPPAVGSVRAP